LLTLVNPQMFHVSVPCVVFSVVLGLMVICSNGLAAKCRIGFRQRIQLRRPEIPQRSYLDPYCLVRRRATTGDTSKPQKKMADSFSGELISLSLG
jgi:hypothetical protein